MTKKLTGLATLVATITLAVTSYTFVIRPQMRKRTRGGTAPSSPQSSLESEATLILKRLADAESKLKLESAWPWIFMERSWTTSPPIHQTPTTSTNPFWLINTTKQTPPKELFKYYQDTFWATVDDCWNCLHIISYKTSIRSIGFFAVWFERVRLQDNLWLLCPISHLFHIHS